MQVDNELRPVNAFPRNGPPLFVDGMTCLPTTLKHLKFVQSTITIVLNPHETVSCVSKFIHGPLLRNLSGHLPAAVHIGVVYVETSLSEFLT